jgi:hypothetical protein
VNETKAETQVPNIIPGMSPAAESAVGVTGVLLAVVSAILHFRRKASRDGNEIVKDRTESELFRNMIADREGVLKERDAARESERTAWTKHNEVAVENARLKAENDYQQREIKRLTEAMQQLQIQFDEIKLRLQKLAAGATGHTGFNDLDA